MAIFLLKRLEWISKKSLPPPSPFSNSCEGFITSMEQVECLKEVLQLLYTKQYGWGTKIAKNTFI
jgi:hypothetical protein